MRRRNEAQWTWFRWNWTHILSAILLIHLGKLLLQTSVVSRYDLAAFVYVGVILADVPLMIVGGVAFYRMIADGPESLSPWENTPDALRSILRTRTGRADDG